MEIWLIVFDRKEATKRREEIDKRINEIENNKKKALNTEEEEDKKEEDKKEENDDSDDDGKIRHSIKIKHEITKYIRESETEVIYFNIFIIGRNQT